MTIIAPYGTWESPISAADVARGKARLSFPSIAGDEVWWQESRPAEAGRVTVMAAGRDGGGRDPRELLPAPWYARTRVHEYGGRAYLPVPSASGAGDGYDLVFANFADQRLYVLSGPVGPGAPGGPGGPGSSVLAGFATGLPAGARLLWQVPPEALRVRSGPSPSSANGSAVDFGQGLVTDVVDLGRTVEVVVALSSGIELRARSLELPDLSTGAVCRVETDAEAMSVWSEPEATGTPGDAARLV